VKTEFRSSFQKDLANIKDKQVLQKIKAVIEAVEAAQTLTEIANLKKLKVKGNFYRIRIGVKFTQDTITFVRVLSRKDIYKYFP
jgi:mRNA interferase RelE/StbE